MTQQEKVQMAYDLGKEAYYKGIKAPAQDPECLKLLEGYSGDKFGEGLPVLKAWNKAWHYENLKEDNC